MLAVLLVAGTFLLVFGIVLFGGWVMAKLSEVTDAVEANTAQIMANKYRYESEWVKGPQCAPALRRLRARQRRFFRASR